jgi:small GTP-binding protein
LTDERYKYDVFLSHSAADAPVVREIAKGLRNGGLRVSYSERMDRPADAVSYEINNALAQSRVLLLFLSEHSLGDQWTQLEKQTFKFRDPVFQERLFIPVRIDDTPLPDTLRQVEYIEWRAEQADVILARLVAVCKPPSLKPTARGADVPRISPKKRHRMASSARVNTIYLNADNRSAAYGTLNGEICLIDIDKPTELKLKLVGHLAPIRSLEFHKSKPLLLSSSVDRTIRLWDLRSGQCLRTLSESVGAVTAARFAEDAIISCSLDDAIHVWDELETEVPRDLRGHTGGVHSVQVSGSTLVSAGADGTIRVWNLHTGRCLRVLEGHIGGVRSLALNGKGTLLLSGSDDCTVRLWDLSSGLCLNTFDAHTDQVGSLAWHPYEHAFVSGGGDRTLRLWSIETGELLRILDGNENDSRGIAYGVDVLFVGDADTVYEWSLNPALIPIPKSSSSSDSAKAAEQVQYTNAKVLLVGDSGAGKTGLSKRLAHRQWEASAASTVGAWATQWSLPASTGEHGDKEIWLWDFGGQADQRLIHQLYMDDTALAILVFDAQKTNVFESLAQWDRDLTRSTDKRLAKILVAGRIDASPVRVSQSDIQEYVAEHGFLSYVETSALTNRGCSELRDAIVASIDWDSIPWRSSPILFKRLKEEIVRIKDEGRVLMRFNELRDALRLRLPPNEINFADAELKAVLSLLSGPGVILELEFGAWILFQPELINAYSQAVIATMRDDPSELGCVSEQKVLGGDLVYGGFKRIAPEDERFVLLEMHRKLLQRGLCARELTDKDVLLVFPSYYKRNRPELVGHPAVLVSYRFDGVVDEIYSTLVVRLDHTHEFKRDQLWQDAAEFVTRGGKKIGVKLTRQVPGAAAAIEVYSDPAILIGEKIIFVKYVHDHLLQRAARVTRRRHYVCQSCSHSIADLDAAEKRRRDGKEDIGCPMCDARVRLIDDLEALYTSAEFQRKVRRLEGIANEELDNESKERALVGDVISIVALARQISREKTVSDHGIDMEIEFKNDDRTASGQLLFLQLKSGDSYIRTQADGKEVFAIKNARHAEYWANQIAPVMLVIRNSNGEIRWMEIRKYLRDKLKSGKPIRQIEFKGVRLDTDSILKWRDALLAKHRK